MNYEQEQLIKQLASEGLNTRKFRANMRRERLERSKRELAKLDSQNEQAEKALQVFSESPRVSAY